MPVCGNTTPELTAALEVMRQPLPTSMIPTLTHDFQVCSEIINLRSTKIMHALSVPQIKPVKYVADI